MRDIEAGDEALGGRGLEALEGFGVPADAALGRALLDEFFLLLRVARGFLLSAFVFDHVVGRLGDDIAPVVVALAAGAAGDLAEVAHGEDGGLGAVIFPELGEDDGADGDVDADAEGVGAADEFEEAFLRELLDEDAVFREEAGVVDADAVTEPAADFLAVGTVEADAFEGGLQRGFFLLRADVERHQRLGGLAGGALGEVDEVDGGAFGLEQGGDALGERRLAVFEFQRHGAAVAAHGDARRAGDAGHFLFEELRRAEGRGHEEEARAGHRKQRDLPGVATFGVGIVVELVHDHRADVAFGAAVEGDVGEDLGRAAEDAGLRIDGGVAGHHADVLGAEVAAEGEELFVYQRLDGTGVDGAFAGAEGLEVEGGGDEGFAGAGGGVEDDVVAGEEFEDRLFLLGVEFESARGGDREEAVHHGVGRRRAGEGRERGGRRRRSGRGRHRRPQGTARDSETRRSGVVACGPGQGAGAGAPRGRARPAEIPANWPSVSQETRRRRTRSLLR